MNIIIFCFVLSRVPFLLISLSRIQDERPQPLVRCARRSGCRPGRAQWGPGLLQGQHLGGRGACLGSDVLPTLITDFPRLRSHATRHPLILVLRDPGPSRILHMRGPPSPVRQRRSCVASAHAASLGVSPSPHAQDPCRPSPPAAKPSAVARAEQGLGSALSRHRGSGRKGELTRLPGLCPAAFGPQDTPGGG